MHAHTRKHTERRQPTRTNERLHTDARTHARMQTFICKARGCKLDRSSCSSVCRSRISCSFIESLQPATVQFRATAAQLSSRAGGSPCGWAHLISKALSRFFCSCFSCDDFFCAAYKARNFFSASSAVTWREKSGAKCPFGASLCVIGQLVRSHVAQPTAMREESQLVSAEPP